MTDLAVLDKLSYSIENFAKATDYGVTTIREAIDAGDLVARYANSKPVITREDGLLWLRSLRTEKPGRVA
ncbi:hypothetical protein J2D78_01655 [Microbacterium maritypicum]|uniref:hypothetical protein n=1 Tax=Microbacterium maritypicum TaxID=33918 RepID=UPI001B31DEE0|nr:hypothetical protein [Microbacterium liquefaciens]MBP5800780.1 hypothetical protein [Microbacterium liquefaciens]